MSVGAGSIKRAARTAKEGKKTDVSVAAEAAMMEAAAGSEGEAAENMPGSKVQEAATGADGEDKAMADGKKAGKKAEKEHSGKKAVVKKTEKETEKETSGKAGKQASGKSGKQKKVPENKPEALLPEDRGMYEAYGIGQQLPVYLL